jgi:hypothetical protein
VKKINIADHCAGKNVIVVGLPGAFTPTWSSTQVPGYLEKQEALKEAGVEEVIVYCVNDPAVSKFIMFLFIHYWCCYCHYFKELESINHNSMYYTILWKKNEKCIYCCKILVYLYIYIYIYIYL